MSLDSLFAAHVARLQAETEKSLAAAGFDSLVVSSGAPFTFFADDRDAPFETVPHFEHWCPLAGPHHLLHLVPGKKPRLIRYAPEDYWYEQGGALDSWWLPPFGFEEASSIESAWKALGQQARTAYVGSETERAIESGLAANPQPLLARLDWVRSYKDEYEVGAIGEATELGARGHRAARAAFAAGGSEIDIHHAFVGAVGVTERELPYTTIVALDEKGATLHYEKKRAVRNGRVLLLDAGAQVRGYACDITRTTAAAACDARFASLIPAVDALELQLVAAATPGRPYLEVHREAQRGVARILVEHGLLKVGVDEACAKGYFRPFFPHGVGHHLGLQVHDVAGKQADPAGTPAPPPPEDPALRNTRTIEPGHVFTIEPGLYFIPQLLRPYRTGADAAAFDWKMIDALAPFGGVRVEDNVLVTAAGPRNLTRERLAD